MQVQLYSVLHTSHPQRTMTEPPFSPNSWKRATIPIYLDTHHEHKSPVPLNPWRKVTISVYFDTNYDQTLSLASRIERNLWEYGASANVVKRWLLEITSFFLSAICMGNIIGMLHFYKHNSPPHWPLGLTLDILVFVLSKIASAALLLPASEALGQLQWSWRKGKSDKKMWDFKIFDNASRGYWGSFLLLRTKGKSLAALIAAITLLVHALDPFIQQAVELQQEYSDTSPGLASVGKGTIEVRWAYLAPHLGLLCLTCVALIITVIRDFMEQRHVGVYKASVIATLLYGLPKEVQYKLKSQLSETPRAGTKNMREKWFLMGGLPFRDDTMLLKSLRSRYLSNYITKGYDGNKNYRRVWNNDATSVLSGITTVSSPTAKGPMNYSGYKELLTIFRNDTGLIVLYRMAIENRCVGLERL